MDKKETLCICDTCKNHFLGTEDQFYAESSRCEECLNVAIEEHFPKV
jgi:hypothetical protein